MTMDTIMTESSVLKLVHPGGFVELHSEPITASEVMKKNPRHCVTRPDVFKFPWVVVRPESALKLGRVFFIVPNHTLHRLIKAAPRHLSPKKYDHFERMKQKYRVGPCADVMTPKHQDSEGSDRCLKWQSKAEPWHEATLKYRDRDRRIKQQYPLQSSAKVIKPKKEEPNRHPKQQYPVRSGVEVTPKPVNHDQYLRQQESLNCSRDEVNSIQKEESWAWTIHKYEDQAQQFARISAAESWAWMKSSNPRDFDFDKNNGDDAMVIEEEEKLEHAITKLKPCRKQHKDNVPKLRRLKVTFVLPGKE